jgi:hypothetical protein
MRFMFRSSIRPALVHQVLFTQASFAPLGLGLQLASRSSTTVGSKRRISRMLEWIQCTRERLSKEMIDDESG